MKHACSEGCQIQHLIVGYLFQLLCGLNDPGICGVYTVHIRIYLAGVSLQCCSECHCRSIRTAASQGRVIIIFIDPLEARDYDYLLKVELISYTLGIYPLQPCISV